MSDVNFERLAYQQVVNLQKKQRLNFMIIEKGVYLGNTCGYLKTS